MHKSNNRMKWLSIKKPLNTNNRLRHKMQMHQRQNGKYAEFMLIVGMHLNGSMMME